MTFFMILTTKSRYFAEQTASNIPFFSVHNTVNDISDIMNGINDIINNINDNFVISQTAYALCLLTSSSNVVDGICQSY